MADPKGPALVIAIGKKPPGAPSGDDQGYGDDDAAQEGQEIVDKVRALEPDDLTKLFAGISPDALAVMQKVDCLAPLADFIQNGGKDDDQSQQDQSAPPPSNDVRSSVEMAMRKNMPQGAA